jgi:vacuolar-type H+-ATPase subunit E/Vma4
MTNSLIQKITADADVKVTAINAEAAASVAEVQKETERVIAELQSEATASLTKQKAQMELVATAKAEQTAKIATQAAKREAIDALFVKVEADVLAESGAAYVARYTKRAEAVLPKGVEVVSIVAPADKAAETKEILTALGITTEAAVSPSVRAGLIVTATDGVYDVSFDRLLSEVRPTLEMELVNTSS